MTLLQLKNIVKTYKVGLQEIKVLREVSLDVDRGEFVSIMGHSGSGKSTLMNIIGMLDTPTTGEYILDGHKVETLNEDELTGIRRKKIGFVFQQYNLLSRIDSLHQVMMPLMYQGIPRTEREDRAKEALERVGLGDRMSNRPNELSGGQQQRVSIARALVSRPEIILADEPTGALDSKNGQEVMQLFGDLNRQGVTVILITHERDIAQHAKKIIYIADGKIMNDGF